MGNGSHIRSNGDSDLPVSDTEAWDKTRALWTGIVHSILWCVVVTGGWMVEPFDGCSPLLCGIRRLEESVDPRLVPSY